jgi:hypothetical protein
MTRIPLDLASFGGVLKSSGTVLIRNLADSAYQGLIAQQVGIANGYVVSDNPLRLLNNSSTAQALYAGAGLVSNDYNHNTRVPANGLYVLGNISTSGGISSYAADLYLARAGASKLGLFTWGTYAYGSFTLDDILNIAAVQATEPPAPATGVKIYLINRAGTTRLEGKFANGVVKTLLTNV